MGADAIQFQIFRADTLVVRRHPGRKALDAVEISARDWRKVLKAARASGPGRARRGLRPPLPRPRRGRRRRRAPGPHHRHGEPRADPRGGRDRGGRSCSPWARSRSRWCARPSTSAEKRSRSSSARPSAPSRWRRSGSASSLALKERFRVPVGFLDQTDGGSAFALLSPALAAAHGADFVEKRFALDRSRKRRDDTAALSPEDFYRMVELLRQAERARGESRAGRRRRRRSASGGRWPAPSWRGR